MQILYVEDWCLREIEKRNKDEYDRDGNGDGTGYGYGNSNGNKNTHIYDPINGGGIGDGIHPVLSNNGGGYGY
jgi:hypothetical protein